MAQLSLEDFDSGPWPPAGWTIIDNIGNGNMWNTSSYWGKGNLSGGAGECAAMDDDFVGSGQRTDTELITPLFDVPANTPLLEFDHRFETYIAEFGYVDSAIGGGPWTNLRNYSGDITFHESIDLTASAGATGCQIRFRYDDNQNWGWYWHVDDVEVFEGNPPPVPIWEEDFDSGTWPPVGWTVIDNIGNGNVWNTSSFWATGNLSGGAGECAAMDDDALGAGQRTDTELISSTFDIPVGHYYLEFKHNFNTVFNNNYGDVDISVGGGPWVNLITFGLDSSGLKSVSLEDYGGATGVRLRFHYDDGGLWAWFWHIDELVAIEGDPPPVPIWEEGFDGGTFPPAGWTVVDNVGNGNVWNTSAYWISANYTERSGVSAAIDDDFLGAGQRTDTELITPSFSVPGYGLQLAYSHHFDVYLSEDAYVDVKVDGGPWTNLATYSTIISERLVLDTDPYVGSSLEVRFRYDDQQSWGWYWHVDDVGLYVPGSAGPGTPFCFGDGSGTPCPCGNDNDGSLPNAGCANGQYSSGARLTASGLASVTSDTLVLHGEHTENNQSGLYFQANNDLSPGLLWGDGLRCAGGSLKRLGVRFSDGTGYSDTSAWAIPISVKAGNVSPGDTKYYQLWYRNPFSSPCAAEFNASNGLAITWTP